ncbi:uncharacterized protein METZ01_LOCUS342954 [marine metagenome]|uniref:Uncharacterized protein n=1 Tax=marine metagenome TaxID=408172 RepID=A0A382QYV0_9ZZZZ
MTEVNLALEGHMIIDLAVPALETLYSTG